MTVAERKALRESWRKKGKRYRKKLVKSQEKSDSSKTKKDGKIKPGTSIYYYPVAFCFERWSLYKSCPKNI